MTQVLLSLSSVLPFAPGSTVAGFRLAGPFALDVYALEPVPSPPHLPPAAQSAAARTPQQLPRSSLLLFPGQPGVREPAPPLQAEMVEAAVAAAADEAAKQALGPSPRSPQPLQAHEAEQGWPVAGLEGQSSSGLDGSEPSGGSSGSPGDKCEGTDSSRRRRRRRSSCDQQDQDSDSDWEPSSDQEPAARPVEQPAEAAAPGAATCWKQGDLWPMVRAGRRQAGSAAASVLQTHRRGCRRCWRVAWLGAGRRFNLLAAAAAGTAAALASDPASCLPACALAPHAA